MPTHYENLLIWQKAMDIAECVYALTKTFPSSELYGLTSQMRRAAISIPSNIAEGHARSDATNEFKHFLHIAKGSLAELETQIKLSIRIKLTNDSDCNDLLNNLDELSRMLYSFIHSLSNKKHNK
ncbi:MAG: four helix bundle protein [Proteobacteria bacterium]|nr:four helix bundle protein [Pseudomonadota bacterium]